MLKFIRRNAAAPWVKFMFVAIVIVFIFWGVGGMVAGKKADIVARVNGDSIEPVAFDRAYENMLRAYRDVYKDNFKPELVQALDLKGRAVDQLVAVSLMRQEAQRLGMRVSDAEVRDSIAATPMFQHDGRFNKELYLLALRDNRLTPEEYETAQSEELLVKRLQELITEGVHVSSAEVRDRYAFDHEKVNLQFIKVDATALLPEVTVSDDEVQTYFTAHTDAFKTPEQVRLEYVLYVPDKFAERAEISDADIKSYYDNHLDEYTIAEEVRARQIQFAVPPDASDDIKAAVRQQAEDASAKIKNGEDFGAVAAQYPADGGMVQGADMGFFPRGKHPNELDAAAFALEAGQTSEVVESPLGFHIIKIEEKHAAHQRPLDEVRPQIVAALKKDKSRVLAQALAQADRERVAHGESLATVAQAAGLEVASPPPFASTEPIGKLGRNPQLAAAAFTVQAGDTGPVVDTPSGFFVFRIAEKIPSRLPELSAVRDRVAEAARKERAAALAKTKAEMLHGQLQGDNIETLAHANQFTVKETGTFTRPGTYLPEIGIAADLKKDAFQLTTEKPVAPRVYEAAGGQILAVLKERVPADLDEFDKQKDQLIQQSEQRRKSEALEQFVGYLKVRAHISVDQDFLASIPDTGRGRTARP